MVIKRSFTSAAGTENLIPSLLVTMRLSLSAIRSCFFFFLSSLALLEKRVMQHPPLISFGVLRILSPYILFLLTASSCERPTWGSTFKRVNSSSSGISCSSCKWWSICYWKLRNVIFYCFAWQVCQDCVYSGFVSLLCFFHFSRWFFYHFSFCWRFYLSSYQIYCSDKYDM